MLPGLVYVALPIMVLGIIRKYREFTWGRFKSDVSLSGKVFIVTGSNSGVGKETARELARRDACVIMACRDLDNVAKAITDIRRTTTAGTLVPMQLDLASFKSIRHFSQSVKLKFNKVHVLINNAGVYYPLHSCVKTSNGFEMNFGVNHLGHFLLTQLLLDKLKESSPSRIVIVSSGLHEKGQLDLDDLNMEKRKESLQKERVNQAYCASKLANVYHCRELAKRLKGSGVDVYAVCPGFTYTNIFRHSKLKWWQYVMFLPVAFFYLRSPRQGAQTIIRCATDETLTGTSGNFYKNCQPYFSQIKFDPEMDTKLWKKCEELVAVESKALD
ncbi:hypothetical protein RUM44_003665 [Polyplax serrata]|uniref:Retinol dehydrogenase 11 n=1 Tax=Polyplax serrata TaxID=468196 RepID=A0ABR1AH35_POLSC